MEKSYSIALNFTDIQAKNPLEAVKSILEVIKESADTLIYDVVEEEGEKNKFTVDLSENDEDAVLPNND